MDYKDRFNQIIKFASNFVRKFSYPILSIVLILGFGLWFAFKIPPLQIADEIGHFYRVYGIVDGGQLEVTKGTNGRYGDNVPATIKYFSWVYNDRLNKNNDVRDLNQHFKNVHFSDMENEPRSYVYFENIAAYAPVSYSPQVAGFSLAKSWNLSLYDAFVFAKIFALLTFMGAVLCSYAFLPRRAWPILFTLTALPNMVQQAASFSADSFTNTMILLYLSSLAGVAVGWIKSKKHIFGFGLVAISLIILALCKPIYVLFGILPIVLINKQVIKNNYLRFTLVGAMTIAALVLAVAWNHQISDAGMNYAVIQGRTDLKPALQMSGIISHPAHYIHVLINTFLLDKGNMGQSWFGTFVGHVAGTGPILPIEFETLGLAALCLAVFKTKNSDNKELGYFSTWQIFLAGLIGALTTLAIVTVLYITFTTYNSNFIMGLQGRYLIPIAMLTIILALWRKIPTITMRASSQQIFIVAVSLINLLLMAHGVIDTFTT